jgi:hypothetical protein
LIRRIHSSQSVPGPDPALGRIIMILSKDLLGGQKFVFFGGLKGL